MTSSDDPEFFKQLLETFKIEAEDHIRVLSDELIKLEKDFATVATPEKLETIYREAHSLKGAARTVGLETIQNICQAFENVLSALRDKKIGPSKELFRVGFDVLDYVKVLVEDPQGELSSPDQYNEFIKKLNDLVEAKPAEQASPPPEAQPPEAKPPRGQAPRGQAPRGQAPRGQAPRGKTC